MKPAALLIAASVLAVVSAGAQGDRSLTDLDAAPLLAQGITIPPPILDPPVERRPTATRDSRDDALQEQILLLRSSIRTLTESLALANSESEVFKRQAGDLSLRLEALGIPGLSGDPGKLEQRLVSAVRDLRVAQERLAAAETQLVRLSETVQILISNSQAMDPTLRMNVEAEIRRTNELLGAAKAAQAEGVEAGLTDALVVDVKSELSLVIANIGQRQGVRIGMPFQVWRESQQVGTVRVVDVRERISGAIIQSLENEKNPIKPGDRLRVDTKK